MSEPDFPLDADDIIEDLRSDDADDRTEALNALFPNCGGAILVHVKDLNQTVVTASTECDASRSFAALLYLAQQFGKHLGLQLQWVPEPEDRTKLVIPNGPERLPRQ